MGGSKTLQIRHGGKVKCLDISNVVDTTVVKFNKLQPHEGSIHLLSAKKTKIGRKEVVWHLELFQQIQFVIFCIYLTCRLQKFKKALQGFFAYV